MRDKAPTHGEWRKTLGEDEASQRRAFQQEIRALGERSQSVRDFFEGLEAAGFSVRVQVDAGGVLRGVSFARGDFAFRGSQLGRDLSGSKLLSTFGLSYDPVRDAAVLEARQREAPGSPVPAPQVEPQEPARAPLPPREPVPPRAPQPVEPPRAGYDPSPAQQALLLEEVQRLRRLYPKAQDDRAGAVQREALEPRPAALTGSRYSALVAEVEQVRRDPEKAESWASYLSTAQVIRGAHWHNREALREIDTGLRPNYHPGPLAMLLAVEAQIERNLRAAGTHLRPVEDLLDGRRTDLERAAVQASREPGLQSTSRWQEAVAAYRQAFADYERTEGAYFGWLRVQAGLDRERVRAALLREPGAATGRAFAEHVARADRLALQARAYAAAGEPRWGAHRLGRAEVERRLEAFGAALCLRGLRPTRREARDAAQLYRVYQRFERAGDFEGLTERSSRDAARTVVRQERPPTALRRLHTALLREARPEAVPPPRFVAPIDAEGRLERLEQLSEGLLRDAAELARLGRKAPESLKTQLLQSTSEAVLLERLLDVRDREGKGIPNPGHAPPGTSPTLWRAAWLVEAQRNGLPVEDAAAHLANLPSVAVQVSRSPVAHAAASIAFGALRHYARKLEEELERTRSQTRSRGLTLG